jgi:diguanylate cyclase (GGDEF)-like protein
VYAVTVTLSAPRGVLSWQKAAPVHDIPADEVPCGLVELDAEGRITGANALFRAWVGTRSIEGRRLAEFVDSSDPERVLASGDIVFLIDADGPRRPVIVEGGAREGVAAVFDATRRQAVEDGLLETHALVRRTQNRLQLVIDASIAFAAARTESELAGLLADSAARAYAAEESMVFLADDAGRFTPAAGTYPFGDLAFGELLALPGLSRGDVVKIAGMDRADAIAAPLGRAFASAGVHSVIVAPVRHEADVLGFFVCFFLHPRGFDEQASPLASALAGQAGQVITSLRLQRQLEHAATHDEITGLPNRRYLEEHLRLGRSGAGSAAILFVDLDGFKSVNDRFGHAVGDRLLREVGERLRSSVRAEHVVARYGGDEFVIVAEGLDGSAAELAERLRRRIEEPYDAVPEHVAISASIGFSVTDGTGPVGTDRLIRLADQAMYAAKGAGGNRVTAA